jgi:hypothetical protein
MAAVLLGYDKSVEVARDGGLANEKERVRKVRRTTKAFMLNGSAAERSLLEGKGLGQ